jgi:peroxiredoxin Q, (thioredoxinreductase)
MGLICKYFFSIFRGFQMRTLKVGENAPHFTLLNQNNEAVSLTQFQGKKILVYFYPKALTPGCTTQACGLRDSKAELENLGVVILGISPDSPKKLVQFIEKKELNFTLLSDEEHLVAEQFGVWGEKKFMGRTFDGIHRISFLIDEQGKIAQVFDKFKTTDHHQVVLDYLKNN